jgi:hypothetical protein
MKILFAGPSLAADLDRLKLRHGAVRFAGPVARGDVLRAVRRGATAIGIVDGLFREVPPVWHKEILYALSLGVAVAGGASMGALRAVECAAFGMVGLGDVYRLYADGMERDDAAVAQVHAPGGLGWIPLSEAAVTVDATIHACRKAGSIPADEAGLLLAACRAVFHEDRTLAAVVRTAAIDPDRKPAVLSALTQGRMDIKRQDGMAVVDWLVTRPDRRGPPPTGWTFAETGQWMAFLAEEDGR